VSPKKLWIGGYGPEQSAHGKGLKTFKEAVEAGSGGEVEVDITWNIMAEGRPNTDLFELVEAGHMFFCYFSSSYLGNRVPELDVLETPFLFPDLPAAHRALDGPLGDALAAAVRGRTGFDVLGFWDNGFRHMTNRLRPIHRPADCAGMTVRLQPNVIHEELIRSWGAVPVAVELSAGIQLITRLDVDAQENPLANTVAYGVDQVHNHLTMTGHLYGARGLFCHRHTLEGFDDDLRHLVTSAAARAVAVQREAAAQLEGALRELLERAGAQFVDLSEQEREEFVAVSAPAIEMARDRLPEDLLSLALA
jgi:TRAP-type C4-dicarboxylate transport system substrate-binding protein